MYRRALFYGRPYMEYDYQNFHAIPSFTQLKVLRPSCDVVFSPLTPAIFFSASSELQRMASPLLHLLPLIGRILRPQHVRGGGGRELPQVSGKTGERGPRQTRRETCQVNGTETPK